MSKMRALLVGATAAGALAAGSLIPAHATEVGPVTITQDGTYGSLYADGSPIGYLDVHGDPAAPGGPDGDICGSVAGNEDCLTNRIPG